MTAEHQQSSFADLCGAGALVIGDGYRAKLEELGGSGPMFLRAGKLSRDGFDWTPDERFLEGLTDRVGPKMGMPGDTVITTKGNSTGRTGYVPSGSPAFVYSPHLSFWRSLDHARIDPGYLRYWAQSPEFRKQLNAMAHGTDMAPYFSLADQLRLVITLPSIGIQREIAATLGALDDKVESNRRLINLVPQFIRARVGRSIGEEAHQVPVASLARFVNGGAYTKGASGTGRMVIRIAELNSGPGGSTVYSDIDVPGEKTALPGDLLMSWSGSLGIYRWGLDEAIVNQHIFKVIPSEEFPSWLVFDRLDHVMAVFQGIARDKATTMGHIQRGHLESTAVSVPSRPAIEALDRQLNPLWDRLCLTERENVTLTALRDTLLDELLSRRVRVPEGANAARCLA